MSWFNDAVDDFHVNLNLNTELEIACDNEAIFHYFEMFGRAYPDMKKFEAQDGADWIRVFEEDRDKPDFRWLTVEKQRISSGYTNPPKLESAYELHRKVLEVAPTALSVSPLNVKALDLMFGFDMTYEGNHDEIVARALAPPCFDRFVDDSGTRIINFEPNITFAVDEACNVQCRLAIETRTSVPQVVSGRFEDNQFSVFFTVRQYWSPQNRDFRSAFERLAEIGEKFVDRNVIPQVIKPLAEVIASL